MAPTQKISDQQTDTFIALLKQLYRIDPEFPLHYSLCLAEIARDEGLSLTQLADRVELSLSTVSRIIAALSQFRPNGHSYGLVELRISPEERRRKELFLTPKGWALMRGVASVLSSYRTSSGAAA